jgi:hypothetical protein
MHVRRRPVLSGLQHRILLRGRFSVKLALWFCLAVNMLVSTYQGGFSSFHVLQHNGFLVSELHNAQAIGHSDAGPKTSITDLERLREGTKSSD